MYIFWMCVYVCVGVLYIKIQTLQLWFLTKHTDYCLGFYFYLIRWKIYFTAIQPEISHSSTIADQDSWIHSAIKIVAVSLNIKSRERCLVKHSALTGNLM